MSVADITVFTALWSKLPPTYQERIPIDSQTKMSEIGILITSDEYTDVRNQVFDTLVNQIAKTVVWNKSITNRLSMFKTGTITYGDTIQEIVSDVIKGMMFRMGKDDQFEKFSNNVMAAYHRINREDFYPVTIEQTHIERAFRNEGNFQSLISSLVGQMVSSNNLDEFLYMKNLFHEARQSAVPSQIINIPDIKENLIARNQAAAFVMAVKGIAGEMIFPKREFNRAGVMMQCEPSEMQMIVLNQLLVSREVTLLANMFNPVYADLKFPLIPIDNFGVGEDDLLAIICDKRTFQVYDTLRTVRIAENGRNLYRNYFYHVHQAYMASPFTNCVFITGNDVS